MEFHMRCNNCFDTEVCKRDCFTGQNELHLNHNWSCMQVTWRMWKPFLDSTFGLLRLQGQSWLKQVQPFVHFALCILTSEACQGSNNSKGVRRDTIGVLGYQGTDPDPGVWWAANHLYKQVAFCLLLHPFSWFCAMPDMTDQQDQPGTQAVTGLHPKCCICRKAWWRYFLHCCMYNAMHGKTKSPRYMLPDHYQGNFYSLLLHLALPLCM